MLFVFLNLSYLFFFLMRRLVLLVSQDGSVFRHFIILFGICLFTKRVICSVKLFAYMSLSLFLMAFNQFPSNRVIRIDSRPDRMIKYFVYMLEFVFY